MSRPLLAAILAVVAGLGCTGAEIGPEPDPEGSDAEIAYWGAEPDGPGIYLARVDGKNVRLIAPTDGYLSCLSWSPDGQRLTFSRSNGSPLVYQTWVVDVETKGEVRLTNGPEEHTCPSWSPDGSMIAYFFRSYEESNGIWTLRRIRPDGSDDQLLTSASMSPNRAAWSPDSRQLIVGTQNPFGRLAVLDPATGVVGPSLSSTPLASWAPTWSSDGRMIAFAGQGDVGIAVYVMNADGTNQRRLSPAGTPPFGGGTWPTWSPDGQWVAYEANDATGPRADVMVTDIEGKRTALVVRNARQPAWRPSRK